MTTPKIVPYNIEAEQSLLGCLMYEAAAFHGCEGLVTASDFYEPFHQKLFVAIVETVQDGRRPDPVTLRDRFTADKAFNDLGGLTYLADLVERCPPMQAVEGLAKVIAEHATRRELIRRAHALYFDAQHSTDTCDRIVTHGEASLAVVAQGAGMGDQWIDGGDLSDVVDLTASGKAKPSYITTGYSSLDAAIGGLRKGRVTVLAARPSMGKSAVASEMGRMIAAAGYGVGIASLEMDDQEIGLRLACGAAYDPWGDTRDAPVYFDAMRGTMTPQATARMVEGARTLRGAPLFVDCRSGLTPARIIAAAKRLLRKMRKANVVPGVIIVDHLHIVSPDEPSGNRVVDVGAISGAFRDFAKQEDVAVLLLAQLSREVENRKVTDKRPQLSDLRWSGEVEQDANTILFLYRPEYYLQEPADQTGPEMAEYLEQKERFRNVIQFLARKNRGGPNNVDHEMKISLAHNAMWQV